jgi:hypothetical protein
MEDGQKMVHVRCLVGYGTLSIASGTSSGTPRNEQIPLVLTARLVLNPTPPRPAAQVVPAPAPRDAAQVSAGTQ